MSEDIGELLPLPKNIPKNYLKLSYPVQDNDKVLVGFNRFRDLRGDDCIKEFIKRN